MTDRQKFAKLRGARRVWAVASIHGEAGRLDRLHRALSRRLVPGDRIVYLGNLVGRGPAVAQTVDLLLRFRAALLAGQNSFACDLVYLRGAQEEMWQKLLQLQFATDPQGTLAWMLDHGVGSTLEAYGSSAGEARRRSAGGVVDLTRWTSGLRAAMQSRPGHHQFFAALRRAAATDDGRLLFVNAGLDPARPLETQRDSFWWGGGGFSRMTESYGSYRLVVRGHDAERPGILAAAHRLTVDGGCGFGGPLLAACVTPEGELADQVEG